jgi:ribosomal-protein-alanine N-acetyltransferase
VKGSTRIETPRLLLRRPSPADAEAIFSRYSSDPDVTRYVGWPRHRFIEQTEAFLASSDAEWDRWAAGPYLIESRTDQKLLGSTGLALETPTVAATGYVLARDEWGQGYATEALGAMVVLAREMEVRRLYAVCHPGNLASVRVLEKCGFALETRLEGYLEFPNLEAGRRVDCLLYSQSV